MNRGKKVGKIIGWAVIGVLAVGLFILVTQYLWNWLIPSLFNGPALSFWQAAGLLVLSKILFSGFGGKGGHHRHGHWKPYWKERWAAMSPDERERFRQKMKDKWCGWSQESGSPKDSGTSNV